MVMLFLFLVILLLIVILVTKPLRRSNQQLRIADPETQDSVQRFLRRRVRVQGI
jgi:Na+-transporting methylmalonyl-CoA/oxaloacetate decarboxylase gamma subunit